MMTKLALPGLLHINCPTLTLARVGIAAIANNPTAAAATAARIVNLIDTTRSPSWLAANQIRRGSRLIRHQNWRGLRITGPASSRLSSKRACLWQNTLGPKYAWSKIRLVYDATQRAAARTAAQHLSLRAAGAYFFMSDFMLAPEPVVL
jgi:hypothetical protein